MRYYIFPPIIRYGVPLHYSTNYKLSYKLFYKLYYKLFSKINVIDSFDNLYMRNRHVRIDIVWNRHLRIVRNRHARIDITNPQNYIFLRDYKLSYKIEIRGLKFLRKPVPQNHLTLRVYSTNYKLFYKRIHMSRIGIVWNRHVKIGIRDINGRI